MSGNPEISVVIPCLNEEAGIKICLEKAKRVFKKENIKGEIIVVDNGSADKTGEIALSAGAKVVFEDEEGYGSAYIRGLKEAKGDLIIIADGDNTYDFSEIPKFINPLKRDVDFVIGNRFKGRIHKGSMPFFNRYVGNPVLSGLYRMVFKTKISDIHCGMRAFTRRAYEKMDLKCKGMEFAAEMVMEAINNHMSIEEVPVNYFPREGKSKLRALPDAWRHIKFIFKKSGND